MGETSITRTAISKIRRELPGAYVRKIAGGPYQASGMPDLLVCWRGRFVAIEMKMPGKKPTRIQEAEIGRIRDAGGIAEVATSAGAAVEVVRRASAQTHDGQA
jgi:Holliday junction resolvase